MHFKCFYFFGAKKAQNARQVRKFAYSAKYKTTSIYKIQSVN